MAAFFTTQSVTLAASPASWPANLAMCAGPGPEVTPAQAVAEAKRCYWQLYPEQDEDPGERGAPQRFPLDPDPEAGQAVDDSDEEALEALQAALGAPAASGGAGAE
jgi:hypothetical protein